MSTQILLEARGLGYRYGARRAVRGLNLTIARGECLGLLGQNGAGKSTTLRMLAGVLTPGEGTIAIAGINLLAAPLAARRHLGYLPDVPPVYGDMTVGDYLALCADLHGCAARADAVARATRRCGLDDVGPRYIRTLSKGYQQRIGIAQAIVHEPALLILDEPTVGLDPRQLHALRELIRELARDRAVILSTHLLSEVQQTCTRVAILHEGALRAELTLGTQGLHFKLTLGSAPDARDALGSVPGVTSVTALGNTRWQLEVAGEDVADGIARLVLAHGWGLRELRLVDAPLEQTFLALTAGQATPC